jgi:hypothetical protein
MSSLSCLLQFVAPAGGGGPCERGIPKFLPALAESDCEAEPSHRIASDVNIDRGQPRSKTSKMAAFVKAVNAKIRAHPVLNYVCSTRRSLLLLLCAAVYCQARVPVIGQFPRSHATASLPVHLPPLQRLGCLSSVSAPCIALPASKMELDVSGRANCSCSGRAGDSSHRVLYLYYLSAG